jgi:hypothetical protein
METLLANQLAVSFNPGRGTPAAKGGDPRVRWTVNGDGTGQYVVADEHAGVFVGFVKEGHALKVGPATLTKISVPFLTAMAVANDGRTELGKADEVLLTLMARTRNDGMKWNEKRNSVGTDWGKGPMQIERVRAELAFPVGYQVFAVDAAGKTGAALVMKDGKAELDGSTCWYLLRRTGR